MGKKPLRSLDLLFLIRNQKGQTTILVPLGVLMVTTLAILTYSDFYKKSQGLHKSLITKSLLQETTLSAFAIMESALKRRMWEAPPDENCLKSEKFSVSGKTPYGTSWEVNATYDLDKSILTMVATGKDKYKNETQFVKQIKIMDTSDYLLISTNEDQALRLTRDVANMGSPARTRPTSLVAGHRRIFVKSPVEFMGNFNLDRVGTNYNTPPANLTNEQALNMYGTIIQGERIQFPKGVRYGLGSNITTPYVSSDGNSEDIRNAKAKALFDSSPTPIYPLGVTKFYRTQQSSGGAIFYSGNQTSIALKHVEYLNSTNTPATDVLGLISLTNMEKQVYPYSLAGKSATAPIITRTLSDNGNYENNFHTAHIFNFTFDTNYKWAGVNASCLMESGAGIPQIQYCSFSEAEGHVNRNIATNGTVIDAGIPVKGFPKGFSTWREDAGLSGSLYTSESEDLKVPTLDWDNFDALKDDAKTCGYEVAEAEDDKIYEDCQIWDNNFITQYKNLGASSVACSNVIKLNQEDIVFNNFNKTLTKTNSPKKILRRVIYSKNPIEIAQKNSKGLLYDSTLTHSLSDVDVRSKLPIWIVNEDYIVFRGYQKDLTSPLDERPGDIRQIYFNKDLDSTSTESSYVSPLNLVVLSPEKIHIISPQYKPLTKSHMLSMYPVDASRKEIVPIKYNITDHERYNEDAYKYGIRDFNIEYVALVTNNKNVGFNPSSSNNRRSSNPNFFFKGLWYIGIYNEARPRYLCMTWDPVHTPTTSSASRGNYIISSTIDPVSSSLPPASSNFYLSSYLDTSITSNQVTYINALPNGTPMSQASLTNPSTGSVNYGPNFGLYGLPWVFAKQYYQRANTISAARKPIVTFTGLSMNFPFAKNSSSPLAISEGLRDLELPKYDLINQYRMDLRDRKFSFSDLLIYNPITDATPCMEQISSGQASMTASNLVEKTAAAPRVTTLNLIDVNNGENNLQFQSPNLDFNGLGAIVGVELPVFKIRGK